MKLSTDGKVVNLTLEKSIDEILKIISEMAKAARTTYGPDILLENTKLLVLLTGGNGDFSIYLKSEKTSLYMIMFIEENEKKEDLDFHKNVKCTNYLSRSYLATIAKKKGGYVGVEKDMDNYLLEASIATVGVLLKNGDFIIPPFTRIIEGTTAIKILDYVEQ